MWRVCCKGCRNWSCCDDCRCMEGGRFGRWRSEVLLLFSGTKGCGNCPGMMGGTESFINGLPPIGGRCCGVMLGCCGFKGR